VALTVTVLTDDVANEGLDILQRVGSLLSRHRTKLIPMKQAGTLNHMRMSTEPHARHQDAPNIGDTGRGCHTAIKTWTN